MSFCPAWCHNSSVVERAVLAALPVRAAGIQGGRASLGPTQGLPWACPRPALGLPSWVACPVPTELAGTEL